MSSDPRARRYLATLAAALGLMLAAGAGAIYVCDPFQVLRRSRGTENLYGVAEYQIPGLARHYDYDTVIVGTSTSNNFRPDSFSSASGRRAMNFALAGSSIEEQRAVLDVALRTGRVRRVFWGIDPFAFRPSQGRPFPYYLYRDPGWRTAPYFVSLGALQHLAGTLLTPPAKRTSLARWDEDRNWDHSFSYGRRQVLGAWNYRHVQGPLPLPETAEAAGRVIDDQFVDVMRRYPSVHFDVVLLPYTVLYYKMMLVDRPREFDLFCGLDREIVARSTALPNVAVHNFRDAADIMLDFDRFLDLLHFSGDVSRQIVAEVADGRRRVTSSSFQGVCGRLRTIAAAYDVPAR